MSRWFVACDIGGTAIKGALLDENGSIVRRQEADSVHVQGREQFVGSLCRLAAELARGRRVDAVGLGIAGMLDSGRTVLLESPNMPLLNGLPLKSLLEQELGCPVVMENDANAAALGELHAGAGRAVDHFLFCTLGTGVGSGLILDHRLWTGEKGLAGEFGHVTVYPDGELCGCGKRGCLEAHASGTAIVRMARAAALGTHPGCLAACRERPDDITPEKVYRLAQDGDAVCAGIYRSMARGLAIAIGSVNSLLDLHTFIIGGGVSRAYDLFHPMVMDELERRLFRVAKGSVRVLRAELGNDAGLYGAGFAAREALARQAT